MNFKLKLLLFHFCHFRFCRVTHLYCVPYTLNRENKQYFQQKNREMKNGCCLIWKHEKNFRNLLKGHYNYVLGSLTLDDHNCSFAYSPLRIISAVLTFSRRSCFEKLARQWHFSHHWSPFLFPAGCLNLLPCVNEWSTRQTTQLLILVCELPDLLQDWITDRFCWLFAPLSFSFNSLPPTKTSINSMFVMISVILFFLRSSIFMCSFVIRWIVNKQCFDF